ncbi:streptophobe family protein [Streptomyces sp. NPDC090306]|uniref:streptophobe family protein n=1 Tax=Streptomyces sp. NPDC090306 TaxID=3365961 RepID=UPI0037FDB887
MTSAASVRSRGAGRRPPWGNILLSAVAAVSWALIGMAGTAALGLHLVGADRAGSLGPLTAAAVALGSGGSVTPSGDVSAFGLSGAEAHTAVTITPLGVGLVGALLLSWLFLRSLRGAGVEISAAELVARAGSVAVLFVAMLGGLAWAGHDVVTIDGASLGLDDLPGGGSGGAGGTKIPGLGDLGDLGGLLPGKVGDLVDAKAAVGFAVDTGPTLLGGLAWVTGVLLIALLASRRTPLPPGWGVVHRAVRPAVSALVAVLLVAVAAGLAAAGYAALRDDHPGRIAGSALLGAPNGVWLAVPLGLFVPWDGTATGALTGLLPDPLDRLLDAGSDRPVTLGRLAELDHRVWLLAVATALMMLLAGVLTAVRTPYGGSAAPPGVLRFAEACALRLGTATALALPLLTRLTDVSVNASLSVLGLDAFGAGVELHGHLAAALLLGALWGAGAGAAGALLARAAGAAGRRAAVLARGAAAGGAAAPDAGPRPPAAPDGPYAPGTPYRPPNPDTNPYLRVPEELRQSGPGRWGEAGTQGAPGPRGGSPRGGTPAPRPPGGRPGDDVAGAETMIGPVGPGTPGPRRPGGRPGGRPPTPRDDGPPPPPPPPPPPRGGPRGQR